MIGKNSQKSFGVQLQEQNRVSPPARMCLGSVYSVRCSEYKLTGQARVVRIDEGCLPSQVFASLPHLHVTLKVADKIRGIQSISVDDSK